ncbi:MAG: hypothetical protein EZS28_019617 [Streblomastix strix]|uniref:Uncharacterized protein n=1 Tax=Streblomastix strix TaxID=222440 RepID=A0A5J4VQJ6_9EUKA|nr:MAG: hypothetical protein EZS28_019617 [Streblomastix strix]
MSFQQKFVNQFEIYTEYESKQEQEAAIKLRQMQEGICGMEFKNFNPKSEVISSMERQDLVSKVRWKHANRLWKVPFIAPLAYGERFPIVRNAIESSGAIQHVFLDLLRNVAVGNTGELIDKLIDRYKLTVLAKSDVQLLREQMAGIARNRSIWSGQTRERNKEIVDKQEKQDNEILKEITSNDGTGSRPTTIMINQIHSRGKNRKNFTNATFDYQRVKFKNRIVLHQSD